MNIPLFKIYTDEADVEAVAKVIRRGSHWTCGPEIEEFEEQIADYIDVPYAVAFNSGTSALHAALLSMKIGKKDRVAVPSFTFPATANMILAVGAKVLFIDIEEETYGMDFNGISNLEAWTAIPVSYAGCPCRDLEKIVSAVPKVIEDAAESLGAEKDGIKVGCTADITMFSLCQAKVITTGDGGLLTTNSLETRDRLLAIRDHGKVDGEYCVSLGYNWRMSSMTATLGISQLDKIEDIIEKRIANRNYLTKALVFTFNFDCLKRFPEIPKGSKHIFQMYTIRVPEKHRNTLLAHLNANGIGAKVYFPPVHLMPLYRELGWNEGDLPVTEQVSKEVITLPMYPSLTTEEMDYMVSKIKEYFEEVK